MEGHPVRFLCEARGVPAPDITWFKDGALLPPSTGVVHTRGGRQLQLERAQGSDAGVYTCRASNPVGAAEKATRLEVYGEGCAWPAGRAGRDSDGVGLAPQWSARACLSGQGQTGNGTRNSPRVGSAAPPQRTGPEASGQGLPRGLALSSKVPLATKPPAGQLLWLWLVGGAPGTLGHSPGGSDCSCHTGDLSTGQP